ncbi:hypothetical protein R1sor_002499 [Riccia sorocarpa]|uniref:Uncharacterized protein n=1 Tax=Riccia sorocarpa TaxID=122646 RepID=A0ABD3H1L8_9MARC
MNAGKVRLMVYCADNRMQSELPQAFREYYPEDGKSRKVPAPGDTFLFKKRFVMLLYAHAVMKMKGEKIDVRIRRKPAFLRKVVEPEAPRSKVVEPQAHEEPEAITTPPKKTPADKKVKFFDVLPESEDEEDSDDYDEEGDGKHDYDDEGDGKHEAETDDDNDEAEDDDDDNDEADVAAGDLSVPNFIGWVKGGLTFYHQILLLQENYNRQTEELARCKKELASEKQRIGDLEQVTRATRARR